MNHQLLNLKNLENYFHNIIESTNSTIYRVGNPNCNSLMLLAVDELNNKIYKYSNEYLYLLKDYYKKALEGNQHFVKKYNDIIIFFKSMINMPKNFIDCSHFDKKVISLVTSFSRGSVHGYSGLFCILNQYINNLEKFKDYYIIVWKYSQQGILDIIGEYVSKGLIPSDKIIYINSNITYRFKLMNLIHNKWHNYPCFRHDSNFKLDIVRNHLVDSNKYSFDFYHKRICIIKNSKSTNITQDGIMPLEKIKKICRKYNLYHLEAGIINEVKLINILYNAKILVTSWGTSWFKNQVYLSDNCTDVYVLVLGKNFYNQYKNSPKKCNIRNTNIHYILLDNELNMPDDFLKNNIED